MIWFGGVVVFFIEGGSKIEVSSLPVGLYRTINPYWILMAANDPRSSRNFKTVFREKRTRRGNVLITMEGETKRNARVA